MGIVAPTQVTQTLMLAVTPAEALAINMAFADPGRGLLPN
jgi:hypothetical protein